MRKITDDLSNQSLSSQYTKLVLELNEIKEKALNAKRICYKILNYRLVFGDFPQTIVTIALLIMAIDCDRLKNYLIESNIGNESLKSQLSSILSHYFKYFIAVLVIKTVIGLVLVILKNRLVSLYMYLIFMIHF